ncbi:MAG: hypothetical protein QM527_06420 [Alphaproteobacteria bacterium]|jgi:hypothetical protein|nr:hypothetical protein [Alphaproteobacteria bacterium]
MKAHRTTVHGVAEGAPGLLHNVGGPPRATISWRGLGRTQSGSAAQGGAPVAGHGRPPGMWLQLTISIGQRDSRYRRDWNTAAALLALVEPGHGLAEAPAQERLVAFIEEETARCAWPACLLARRGGWNASRPGDPHVELDHVPTTFVALAKCTGSLWLRDRRPHLAPLQTPTLVEPGSTPMRGVRWSQMLWFPQGIPQELLSRLGTPRATTVAR